MRLFKRRCSDPNPQLVSLQPLDEAPDEHVSSRLKSGPSGDMLGGHRAPKLRSGQASPVYNGTGTSTPIATSPKATRKGNYLKDMMT